jgi:hypothetical protein
MMAFQWILISMEQLTISENQLLSGVTTPNE